VLKKSVCSRVVTSNPGAGNKLQISDIGVTMPFYNSIAINSFLLPANEVKDSEKNRAPVAWCGKCFRPIVNDPDSDLLELLTSDSICHCWREAYA
jgi:hypothetical protein